jgi:G protein beta subunit-like protein
VSGGREQQGTFSTNPSILRVNSCIQGKCYVWKVNEESSNLPRFQAVTKFHAHNKYLTRCLLSPDTKYVLSKVSLNSTNLISKRFLATCSADTTVKIWSISQNYEFKQEKILAGHQRWVWDCAFSADSAYLVTGTIQKCECICLG